MSKGRVPVQLTQPQHATQGFMNHKNISSVVLCSLQLCVSPLNRINEEKQVYRTSTSRRAQEQQHSSRIAFLQSFHGDFQRLDGRSGVEKALAD